MTLNKKWNLIRVKRRLENVKIWCKTESMRGTACVNVRKGSTLEMLNVNVTGDHRDRCFMVNGGDLHIADSEVSQCSAPTGYTTKVSRIVSMVGITGVRKVQF